MIYLIRIILACCLSLVMIVSSIAHPSWGIKVDKDRNIYFADIIHKGRGAVWKLHNDGKLELLLQNFHAHNVTVDEKGDLITANGEDTYFLIRLGQKGKIDTLVFKKDHRDFNGGNCTYGEDGRILFYADKHIWEIKDNGDKHKLSNCTIEWAQTIYGDELGNTYVPEIGDGKGQLVKINKEGKATILARNLISKTDRTYDKHNDILLGITKGCDGHMYICELAGKRVIKVLPNQETQTFYTSAGDWFPSGLDFFSGDAYILEYSQKGKNKGPRIVKIDESGQKSILFEFRESQNHGFVPIRPGGFHFNWNIFGWIILLAGAISFIFIYQNKRKNLREAI